MVDKALFVGMSGQQSAMYGLQIFANNLANTNTPGFRADFPIISAKNNINANNIDARQSTNVAKTYSDFTQGPIKHTGNPLDVAISGPGFLVAQNKESREGYTRAGNLQINQDGFLTSSGGDLILGESGPITIPNSKQVEINKKGMVLALPLGEGDREMIEVGRLKLVEPADDTELNKGNDGLFYAGESGRVESSANVQLVEKSVEGSNIDSVRSLVDLVDVSRNFEFQAKLIKSIDDKEISCNSLLKDLV